MSQLVNQTMRDLPATVNLPGQQFLLRSGLIHSSSPGIFSYLPLGVRTVNKIEQLLHSQLQGVGGQEFFLPAGLSRSEFLDLLCSEARSYRQLPRLLYYFHPQFPQFTKTHAGLFGTKESRVLTCYMLGSTVEVLEQQIKLLNQVFSRLFDQLSLPVNLVTYDLDLEARLELKDTLYPLPGGDEQYLICEHCGYGAPHSLARHQKRSEAEDAILPIEKIATPNCKTIADLARYLNIPTSKTAKAVFLVASYPAEIDYRQKTLFVIIRGDMEVNETKLQNILGAMSLRPATEAEIRSTGAIPGYASPVGLENVQVIVDDMIPHSFNLVAGANLEGYHFMNVNYGRDYTADLITDISLAHAGDACGKCGHSLHEVSAARLAHTTIWDEALEKSCQYLDQTGKSMPIHIGVAEADITRVFSCIAEQHHDEYGLIWPTEVAPYQVHLISLQGKAALISGAGISLAENLYQSLNAAGIDCLFDDRDESPGVKFTDADLIGIPIRLTISERSIKNGGIEYKRRDQAEKSILPFEIVLTAIQSEVKALLS